jgi:hypothetical protein
MPDALDTDKLRELLQESLHAPCGSAVEERWIDALVEAGPALLALAARAERMEAALRRIKAGWCDGPYEEDCDVYEGLDMDEWCYPCIARAALPAADRRAENDKHE